MLKVPYSRPDIGDGEIDAVADVLRSGWLTSGPAVRQFEEAFADAVGASHAVAVSSATAALHLAVEAKGLHARQAALVPTLTFAATAEVVRYQGANPILVDCDPDTLNLDLDDAARKIDAYETGRLSTVPSGLELAGVIPVHVGGLIMDYGALGDFSRAHGLWTVEDAAHAFPASWRRPGEPWVRCGENSADVSCFSFYANKTITTGEGGMAVTSDERVAARMRRMSLHGLSHDAWNRYGSRSSWDYRIVAPGFKYNLTDIAAAIGLQQLSRCEQMRQRRQAIASAYTDAFSDLDEIQLPAWPSDRVHSWHLFPIRLHLDRLSVDRSTFIDALKASGVGCSVHWRPLHLHPYYQQTFGWRPEHCPVATREWQRLVSLPIFSSMTDVELTHVVESVRSLCRRLARRPCAVSA